ncbi:MAG: membrane dipeptidase [Chloroflexi bacterium]|nr:membrane dipeptidase [Chloroflexota bacterium]
MSNQQAPQLFDFGLSAEQEARARRLHDESIVVDMLFCGPCGPAAFTDEMNETLKAVYKRNHNAEATYWAANALPAHLAVQGKFDAFREWWDASGVTAGSREVGISAFEPTLKEMANAQVQFDGLDWLVKALKASDIRRAKAEGKHAGYTHIQDTRAIELNLDRVNLFYDLGMRMVQLTYNSMNYVGTGCTERTDAGLSYFGEKLIRRMNDLGMMVDTGHTGSQTTLDACRVSRAPVIASHTCARALSGHDRGKPDEVIKAVAATGGIVGVVTVPPFLSKRPESSIVDFLDHVDHIVNLIGADHVGIGTDWPNCAPEWLLSLLDDWAKEIGFREEHRVDWLATLKGFVDYREFVNITRGLVSRGYSDGEIKAILGESFMRVFEQICG